jgi:alpha/beta superfamily hydrolase
MPESEMEERITFLSEGLRIEGLWRQQSPTHAAVVTHPHPLYGGDMHNPVVTTIVDSFARKGYATLRFNFRGTGASEGGYDDGPGEQRDLLAALDWVSARTTAKTSVAGYSFGAWVAAGAAAAGHLNGGNLVLVSPPVAFISFDQMGFPPGLTTVVAGARDEFAPLSQVRALVERWQVSQTLAVIDACDHFYSGRLPQLGNILDGCIPAVVTGHI